MPQYNGLSLLHHPPVGPTCPVDVDACLTGIGGRSGNSFYAEELPVFITSLNLSITHLEMLNILIATRLFAPQWANKTVNLGCDNQASVAVLQSAKARDPILAACAKQIWLFAAAHDFTLVPFHKSGDYMQQVGVDALSRAHLSPKFHDIMQQLSVTGRRLRVPHSLFALPPF